MASKMLAVALGILAFCKTARPHNASILAIDPLQTPFPYYFPPMSNVDTPELFPMPSCHGVALEEATIDEL